MKKSIFIMAVVFLAMAMFSTAFAQYENVKVVRETSTQYSMVVKVMMYSPDNGVTWQNQLKVYNNDPEPSFDNPCWSMASNQTLANTVAGSTSNVRYPNVPYVIPTSATGGPAVTDYLVQGSSTAITFFQGAVGSSVTIESEITTPFVINGVEYVLVWSRTGDLFAFHLDQNRISNIRGIAAADLF